MKKISVLVVATILIFGFCEVTSAHVSCPDYKIVCQDNSCHGSYGTCWSWKDLMCLPCQDNNASVCNDHGGFKCVWFSSYITDLTVACICKKIGLPNDRCVVCLPPPPCVE